jgi:methionyl-tRNA synthetase
MEPKSRNFKRYTVTSALPYANGPLHIGHLAGVYVPADIYVRYLRSKGVDVVFIGGSDEHGVPITIKARQQGITPQEVVDKYHAMIRDSFEKFGISFDIYSRTSNPIHHETASEFFTTLYNKGEFIEKTTEQYYDEEHHHFLADRYIVGTCPRCGNEKAYGDQCESCGSSLSPDDLINPVSTLSGKAPVKKETKHWYLPLDKYQPWLEEWIVRGHREDWKPNVYGQCKSWLDHGLQPRAVTRDLDWGVKVPLPDTEGKVLYVWFDAPIGYISATREWAEKEGKDWELYWKDKDTRLIHFIGKDNIVFHCIIFPAMLKHEGSYVLPDNVPAFEFMNLENDKISTSRNWAVWLHEYLKDFPGKQDVLRYVLTTNAPETKDNDFTWKDFQARNNNELLSIFGNFINRTLVLTHKFFGGVVPERKSLSDYDRQVLEEITTFPGRVGGSLENFRFREAMSEFMNLARLGNKYLTDSEPWKLFKTDETRVATIMNISLEICANLAILGEPFLPFSAQKILRMLGMTARKWDAAGSAELLKPGHVINQPEYLFEKIEDSVIQEQVAKLGRTQQQNAAALVQQGDSALTPQSIPPPEQAANSRQQTYILKPQREVIPYDDFARLDIRAATIVEAEKVEGADKLLKLLVDTGLDKRTIVSGIALYYKPEDLIGKQFCFILNLEPRKIRGIESKGMILSAEGPDGKLSLLQPEKPVPNGSEVR